MRSYGSLLLALIFALAVFALGMSWGLPSSEVNHYLFDGHPVWSGQQVIALGGGWDSDANVGADVDRNPIADRTQIVELNDTDEKRAEIVRRYRLFSYQPDEMITFRALSQMGGRRLDPKMYQYGGWWIYPVGALLKASAAVGAVQLRGDLAFYLDDPEAFGRFYVVARAYSAMWGLIGVLAMYGVVKKLTARTEWAALAAAMFAMLPVVVCMSHEAKPHLAGASLTLLALWAALLFLDEGKFDWAMIAGLLCGAAAGMVASAATAFVILPAMIFVYPMPMQKKIRLLILSALGGIMVYAVTNPFVIYHLFVGRELLFSNAGNTQAMYSVGNVWAGAINTLYLLAEATGWLLAIAGGVSWATLHFSPPDLKRKLQLIAAPAIATVVLFSLVGAGKPGEYGRFLILPAAALLVGLVVALRRAMEVSKRRWPKRIAAIVVLSTAFAGGKYLYGFELDARERGTRRDMADVLQVKKSSAIGLYAEPAPYCMPPLDLFTNRLILLPENQTSDVTLQTSDVGSNGIWFSTPISWANKPILLKLPR